MVDARPGPMVAHSCLAFGALLVACAPGGESPRQDPGPAVPSIVTLSTANHTFQAPDTVDAGWITFRFANNGDDIHYAHIVRLDSARSVSDLVAAYAEAIRTSGPRPKWVRRFGGPGGTAPGDSSAVTQQLEPGSYVWICPVEDTSGNPHFGKGEFKSFIVRDGGTDPARQSGAPVPSAVIRLADFSFGFEAPLRAGHHTIRVHNAGPEPHDLVLLKLMPGTTLEEVQAWLNPEKARRPDQGGDPGASPASLASLAGGIAVIAPGMEAFFDADITPGDYVLACMATAPDGRSHIEHGMIQQISVR
jgi:hypothetical protein